MEKDNTMEKQSVVQKWQEWCRLIGIQILHLHYSKALYAQFQEIIGHNADLRQNFFAVWLPKAYAVDTIIGIRRLIEDRKNYPSISLIKLLKEFAAKPELLTRKRFINKKISDMPKSDQLRRLCQRREVENAVAEFTRLFGKGRCVDVEILVKDMSLITRNRIFTKIKHCADKNCAHIDMDRTAYPVPTYEDIDMCISILSSMFLKYNKLLMGYDIVFDHVLRKIERDVASIIHVAY